MVFPFKIDCRNKVFMAMTATCLLIFLLVGCVYQSLSLSINAEEKNLKLVHIVMRHGIRTPASTYPNDPYINDTFYPYGWGQITRTGKQNLYQTGKFLKKRYGKFLGRDYSPDIYYTQSTDVDRTKVSMQMVNAGFWPPSTNQKWGPLNWQPIPIKTEPLDDDMLLLVRKPCPQYHIQLQSVINSPEVQVKFKKYKPMFKEITNLTGQQVEDFDGIQDIFSTLMAEEYLGLRLPEWTRNYYPQKMLPPTIFSFTLNAYNRNLTRFKGGVMLKKLISDWVGVKNLTISPKERKAFLYGGHDATISNLMSALGIWNHKLPEYGIMLMFELSKDNKSGQYGVEIFLRNSTSLDPFKMTIPGCDTFCPLDRLIELREDVVPGNWEEECATDDTNFVVPTPGGP